jgi:predicted RNase H-like nuclease (RuvC/YqgF family)
VETIDLFKSVLSLARDEGALEGANFEEFARALAERARLVLDERVRPLEERVEALTAQVDAREAENAWRRSTNEKQEAEVEWRRSTNEKLEAEVEWRRSTNEKLEAEVEWRRSTNEKLERQIALAAEEWKKAVSAHEQLLAHQLTAFETISTEMLAVARLPLYRRFQARRRLIALVELLRKKKS